MTGSRRSVRFAEKVAVVTGGAGGVGRALVRTLTHEGAAVMVADLSADGCRSLMEEIEKEHAGAISFVAGDLRDRTFCERVVAETVDRFGGVDILFNNAGLALGRYPFWESNPEDEQAVLHTNVDGVLRMTRLCLPHIRDEGHILFMGSVAGRQAYQDAASYVAAKFAVRGFVYALREDLLGRPIRITTVDAGLVETEFSLVRYRGDADAAKAVYEGVDPVTPDEVADCVMFALSRPLHVNVDEIVVKALAQSSGARVVRRT
jgi:3-hydroxy acid dehydrogenase / malonic semialdehyde reductase